MDDGDIQGAVARWESSIDLDPNVYESHYNLASAYIRLEKYQKALEHAKIAQNISKNEPIAYYTLAVAYEFRAEEFIKTKDEDGGVVDKEFKDETERQQAFQDYIEHLKNANENYDKYVTMISNAEDSETIIRKISENKEILKSLQQKRQGE